MIESKDLRELSENITDVFNDKPKITDLRRQLLLAQEMIDEVAIQLSSTPKEDPNASKCVEVLQNMWNFTRHPHLRMLIQRFDLPVDVKK